MYLPLLPLRKLLKFAIASIYFLSFQNCEKELNECFFLDEESVTTTVLLDPFERISTHLNGTYTLKQGDNYQMEIKGSKRYLDSLVSYVHNKQLTIDNNAPFCTAETHLEILITLPTLKHIAFDGQSEVTIDNFKNQNELSIQLSEYSNLSLSEFNGLKSLDVRLSQNATVGCLKELQALEKVNIKIEGNGAFKGYPLPAKTVDISIEGKGYCEVNTLEKLSVIIKGDANVVTKGNPSIYKRITGKGDVHFTD